MSEELNDGVVEVKEKSKTENFKAEIQKTISEILGVKVSKQTAWDLFKALIKTPYGFILNNYDAAGKPAIVYGEKQDCLRLPLSGIGTFEVKVVGNRDDAGNIVASVKPRLYLSSSIESSIKERLGFAVAKEATTETTPVEHTEDSLDI